MHLRLPKVGSRRPTVPSIRLNLYLFNLDEPSNVSKIIRAYQLSFLENVTF